MTKEEKFKAITERLKEKGIDFDAIHLSTMIIVGYLDDLQNLGLVESEFVISPSGKAVRAICEEFDWKPEDFEIQAFCKDMIDQSLQTVFIKMLTDYRDNREQFIEDVKDFQKKI